MGIRPPTCWNFCGVLRNSTTSSKLFLGLVDAGDVAEGHPADAFGQQPRPRLAEAHGLALSPDCIWRMKKIQSKGAGGSALSVAIGVPGR